jgi:hypothetical protein
MDNPSLTNVSPRFAQNPAQCLHPSQPQTALARDFLDSSLQKNPRKITLEAIALMSKTEAPV